MDNEDREADCEVFHRAADPPPPLLYKEVTQRGARHVGSRPVQLRESSLTRTIAAAAHPNRRPRSAGIALYLASNALIAIAIAGIFFGAGYSLLASSVRGPVSSLDYRLAIPKQQVAEREPEYSPRAALSPPVTGNIATVALTPDNPLPMASRAAPPPDSSLQKTSEGLAPAAESSRMAELPARSGSSARPGHDAPEQSATASVTTAVAAAVADRPAPRPSLSAADISDLLKHGDAFLSIGDLTSARLFYERAATAGNSGAALRLGATFDPDFLDRAGLRNVKGDASVARSWYSRALDLGAPEAQRQLNSLNSKQGLPPR